jgi:asparagine synthase (glutamine-hydrolysing)
VGSISLHLLDDVAGKTVFDGVRVAPGHFMQSERRCSHPEVRDFPSSSRRSTRLAGRENRRYRIGLLLDSTRIRLRADVPVGCYLSGGSIPRSWRRWSRNFQNELRTFGVRFDEERFDEGAPGDHGGSARGQHSEVGWRTRISGSISQKWSGIARSRCLDRAGPDVHALGSRARSGYKVVLTGEGADEIFGDTIFSGRRCSGGSGRDSRFPPPAAAGREIVPDIFRIPACGVRCNPSSGRFDRHDDPFYSHRLRWRTPPGTGCSLGGDEAGDARK